MAVGNLLVLMKANLPVLKTRIPSLIVPLCAVIATWLIAESPAQARYVVTLQEVGPNVDRSYWSESLRLRFVSS